MKIKLPTWLFKKRARQLVLSDPGDDFLAAVGISKDEISINRNTIFKLSAVKKAVSLISGDIAKLPLNVFVRQGEGKKKDKSHPAFKLLHHKSNNIMTAFVFKQTLQSHALLEGNGYAFISRRDNIPTKLILLDPDRSVTFPVLINGEIAYATNVKSLSDHFVRLHIPTIQDIPVDGTTEIIKAEDMIHIKGLSHNGIIGLSIFDLAAESIGLGLSMQRYSTKFFSNSANPSIVVEHPSLLSPEAVTNLRKSFERLYSGLKNSHRAILLEDGMTLKSFSVNAKDAQLIESKDFSLRDIANWFDIPPHKLGDSSKTSFSSLEQENLTYLVETLDRWLVNWEEELRDKLLSEQEKENDTHTIEFNREALIRTDLKTKGEFLRISLGGRPWMTQNEARSILGLNPRPDGDTIREPLNMGPEGGGNAIS